MVNKHDDKILHIELDDFPEVFMISKRICEPDWAYNSYRVKSFELILMYSGEAYLTIDGREIKTKVGDCFLLRPGQVFSSSTDPNNPCKYYSIHFKFNSEVEELTINGAVTRLEELIDLEKNIIKDGKDIRSIEYNELFLHSKYELAVYEDYVFSVLEKAIHETNYMFLSSNLMLSNYLCEILIRLSRLTFYIFSQYKLLDNRKQLPQIVQEAVFYINDNYTKPIELNDLCTLLDVSPQYLIRVFKKHLSETPMQYLSSYRIARSKNLLELTPLSIKEITYDIGLDNPYYFSRLFKKKVGMTPSDYRKHHYSQSQMTI